MIGMSQADIIVPLVKEYSATPVIEALMGRPITRKQIDIPVKLTRSPRTQKSDPRVITYLHPTNPKKPGTRAYSLWEIYRVGMTADEFVSIGGRRSALRYDEAHGFIQLGAADRSNKISRIGLNDLMKERTL
jgi:hypothetical protein